MNLERILAVITLIISAVTAHQARKVGILVRNLLNNAKERSEKRP